MEFTHVKIDKIWIFCNKVKSHYLSNQ